MTNQVHYALAFTSALIVAACGKTSEPPVLASVPTLAPAAATTPATTSPATTAPTSAPIQPHPVATAENNGAKTAPLVYPAPITPKSVATTMTRVANFAGLEADIPLSWVPTPPANSMRLAEFQAPLAGQSPAEAVVFFFPAGQGGPQEMNIARWASQFTDSKGAPVKPLINKTYINNMAVTRIELSGNYSRGVGMGATEGAVKTNQILLAAIITTPTHGNVTFHFFGPQASIKKQKGAFEAVLNSIRFKGQEKAG